VNNPRNIILQMDHGGQGDLLTEVVRAYLHTGNPSAFISRVMEGVRKYREEVDSLEDVGDFGVAHLEHVLLQLRGELKQIEDNEYALSQVEF
jgi:hypothetical protein